MIFLPLFLENPEWYYKKKKDGHSYKYYLTKKAPKEAVKSYRHYYAKYYCTESGRIILGEYEDVDGEIYIIDFHGNIKKRFSQKKDFTGNVYI